MPHHHGHRAHHNAAIHHGARHHTHIHIFDEAQLSGSQYVLKSAGADNQCGCVWTCPGSSITCNINQHFLPNELEGKLSIQELRAFTDQLDKIFKDTHLPMFPCIFTHFCLPFSPICAKYYCASQRQKGIAAAIEEANKPLFERGLYWEEVGGNGLFFGYVAMLKVNDVAHQRWLASQSGGKGGSFTSASAPLMLPATAVVMDDRGSSSIYEGGATQPPFYAIQPAVATPVGFEN